MEAVGYLERADENGGLRLGINAKELGAAVLDRFPVTAAATSTLGELLRASGQTVSLHVQVAKMVVRVAGRESTSSVAAALRLGETRLCVDTAMGRVLLAFGSSGTSRGRDARSRRLAAEFDEIRAIGHSLTVDETSVHGQTLAWPIVDAAGVAVCVLALEGPAYQFDASPASIRRLKRIAVPLQAEIQANPHLARRPFAHVPDSEVTLRVGG
jgi:DNA-binding IclR family transcriptional regulator